MGHTTKYFTDLRKIATGIFSAVAVLFSAFAFSDRGGSMIDYYCVSGNPLFIFQVNKFAACPFYVSVGYIFFLTFVVLFLLLVASIISDIFADIILPKISKSKEIENIKNRIPKFQTLRNHAKIIIDDSSAETVINYVHEYFKNTPRSYGGIQDKIRYRISTSNDYYSPKDVGKYGLMVNGMKITSNHVEALSETASITPLSDMETVIILDMFFISAIQGGKDKTEVFFDTQYDDVFMPMGKDILKKIKGVFNVKEVKGLPDDSESFIFSTGRRKECSHCHFGYRVDTEGVIFGPGATTTCPQCGNVEDARYLSF